MLARQHSPVLVHWLCIPGAAGGGAGLAVQVSAVVQRGTNPIKAAKKKSLYSWSLTQFFANCLTKTKAFENYTKTTVSYMFGFLDSLGVEACCNPVLLLLMLF